MGSNGSRALARIACSSSAWSSSGICKASGVTTIEWLPATMCLSVMRFSVNVPVLSTHRTVVLPNVSIAGIRRVSTRLREMRHAPSARKIVNMTGISSGRTDMAMVIPARSPCFQTNAPPPRVSA